MKKILVLTLITFVSAEPQYPADSLLISENTTFLQKLFIYPIAQWQRISYNSNAFNCQFYPSCSNYCSIAIKEKGAVIGSIIGMDRITRCNPSALYYHQKIHGAYKDSDGRIIDNITPLSYQKNNKSELLAVSLSLIPGMGKIYAGRAYDGIYGVFNLFVSLQAYSTATKNKNKFISSVFGLSSIVLYASEIYGSWRAVKYYQPKNK
ncbi:MAG: membrane protein insertion efficiency factor YidD [Candidatus Neomarinimicrobiota bacterium]|tara:strand:+ start:139 stop:759 length:621 start_codon:yes stop_codon:yes gene_type:complete